MRRELTAALVAIAPFSVLGGNSAAASGAARPVHQAPKSYYLALGDSIADGYQPTRKPGTRATAFDSGYVDVFAARLRELSPKIQVV